MYETLSRDFFRQALAYPTPLARIQSMIHDLIEDLKMALTDWRDPFANVGILMCWGGLAAILGLAVCSL